MSVLQSLAKGLGSATVHFLGWQSRQQLMKCYGQANIFYFRQHGGMPNACLKPWRAGCLSLLRASPAMKSWSSMARQAISCPPRTWKRFGPP